MNDALYFKVGDICLQYPVLYAFKFKLPFHLWFIVQSKSLNCMANEYLS